MNTIMYSSIPDSSVGISSKFFVSKLRAFVSMDNILTITSYPGLDPEIGTEIGYPLMRNCFYTAWVFGSFILSWKGFLISLAWVAVLAPFPIVFFLMWNRNLQLVRNLKEARD